MSDDYHYRGNGYRGRGSYRGGYQERGGYQGRGGYRGGHAYPEYRRGGSYRGRPRDSYDSYTGNHQAQPYPGHHQPATHPHHHQPHFSDQSHAPHNGAAHAAVPAVKKDPLEAKMDELKKLNDDVLQLQLQKHKVMNSYTVLERHLKREALNSELNAEKLEEMSWL